MIPILLAALFIAGQAAQAEPAESSAKLEAAPRRAPSPCPNCSIPEWLNPGMIGRRDYPREALRARQQGWVRFRVTVTRQGRATHCVVVESSGSAALDRATCTLVTARARFNPARDAGGAPMEADFWSTVTWWV